MMGCDTRGWRECPWKEKQFGKTVSWALVVLEKRNSEDKKEYKIQALSSFWVEGIPEARSCNHPKEVSEGREFWRGCWLMHSALQTPDSDGPEPPAMLHKWVISALPALQMQPLPGTHVTQMTEKQSPSLSGSCGQTLILACWTRKMPLVFHLCLF